MLSRLIYRSLGAKPQPPEQFEVLARACVPSKQRISVSGILLFDSQCLLQLLEGSSSALEALIRGPQGRPGITWPNFQDKSVECAMSQSLIPANQIAHGIKEKLDEPC